MEHKAERENAIIFIYFLTHFSNSFPFLVLQAPSKLALCPGLRHKWALLRRMLMPPPWHKREAFPFCEAGGNVNGLCAFV